MIAITGGNRGIGLAAAQRIAAAGPAVILVCRSKNRGEEALRTLAAPAGSEPHRVVVADLSSFDSVRGAAARIAEWEVALTGLINNAAVIPRRRAESRDGFELQLAVTHLAHFLLTCLLLPLLRRAPSPARIVTVSSGAHFGPAFDFDDPNFKRKRYRRLRAYQQSKLANVLFTKALGRRTAETGVEALALHPGVYDTGLFRDYMGGIPGAGLVARGAAKAGPILAELVAGRLGENLNGAYFSKRSPATPSVPALDEGDQERLWAWSAAVVGIEPPTAGDFARRSP